MADVATRVGALEVMLDSIQYGGSFYRVGADISNPALTALVAALANEDYNGETFAEGTVLLGDDSAGKVNIIWIPNGGLYLRVGTVPIISLNSAGISTDRGFGHTPLDITLNGGTYDLDGGGDNPTGTLLTSYIHITSAAADFVIRSLLRPTILGHRLVIQNHSAKKMTLTNHGTPGSAAYVLIHTDAAGDIFRATGGKCELIYNNIEDRWDVMSISLGWTV